ncbi:nucleic acid/nucleotide deaminase domain-containing protein [Aspergillus novofumigatus IBT 16806]|uniref:Uncharacterized protein n=1 Tax=Aspergillus novofumigatus (strain IBT 16806) TaxID=1392255 RepID=A0A2I1CFQ0_ASPN1|nr:uncharacterized protein P174DRAFT_474641 [Aspergillus novofumigatus IBT 16806]PKX96418.1 hypothetical protein P174DRAFT_474641 [Aspergillus novofumigatus IBT 16806]
MPRISNPAIKCAEDIAIASLFHNIPVPPSSNVIHGISSGQYVLSLDQERKLAGALAFLAHNREGAEHIPAVCIGEDSATGSLNVIFAVNKANHSDGNNVLHSIQQGFDEIFALLTRVSTDCSPSLKNQVFYMVVSMCSSRILSRLRLGSTGRVKMKRSLKDTLQELTRALTRISQDKLKDRSLLEAVDLLLTRAKEVRKVVDLWSKHQVTARLIELVESIYRIHQIKQLQPIIDIIPNNHMDPTARESFINIVGKVSRYREAARFLYRTAKNVPLARNMRTVPVHLPEEAFTIPSIDTYTPNLLVKVTEASAKGRQQKLLKEICRVLGLSEQQAKDQYCRQVMHILRQAKIHSEVQIIAYFELHPPLTLPRVICSSKDACFLCNLFIKVYGKLHTPRSHGRLYPGWRLPCLPQLQEVEQRFCQSLQGNFQESCTTLLSTKRKLLRPNPIESTLFTLPASGTTMLTTTSLEGSNITHAGPPAHETASFQPELNRDPDPRESMGSVKRSECANSVSGRPDNNSIILQGSGIFGSVGPKETSEPYSAGPLEIVVEDIAGSSSHSYRIEWLDDKETRKARGEALLIDVEEIEEEITLCEHNPLYMTARGAILRLSWTSENAR